MDSRSFERFRKLIYDKSGITLREGKESLVESRIAKRLRDLNLPDLKQYLNFLEEKDDGEEIVRLLDVISTNVTYFFREPDHFAFLEEKLGQWMQEGQSRFRLWSAASSTGEEPYSIAMTAAASLPLSRCDLRILGTDISTRVLDHALAAQYPVAALEGVPSRFRLMGLLEASQTDPELCRVREDLKRLVSFARLNLSAPPFPMKGPFDLVFCRNVMIYFDDVVRERLVREIERLLRPGGYLLVGHSESLMGLKTGLKMVRASIYQKDGSR